MNIEEYQQQFLQLLHTRVVTFHYRKKNRSLRKAIGTTCLDLIPTDSLPKGIGCSGTEGPGPLLRLHGLRLAHAAPGSCDELQPRRAKRFS